VASRGRRVLSALPRPEFTATHCAARAMPFRGAAVRVMARLQCGVNRREELNTMSETSERLLRAY